MRAGLHGLGNHWEILLEHGTAAKFLKYLWLCITFFCLAISTGKAAVAAFLLDIIGPSTRTLQDALLHIDARKLITQPFQTVMSS